MSRDGRPLGHAAACWNRFRQRPKLRLSRAEAEERSGPGVNAYLCTHCRCWHVGHPGWKLTIQRSLASELGWRAVSNLRLENTGAPQSRVRALSERGRRSAPQVRQP